MKSLIPLILFLFLFLTGQAQDSTYNEYLSNGRSGTARVRTFDWKERFYFGGGGSLLIIETPYSRGILPLVSLVPRLNLKEYDNRSSLSLISNTGFILQFSSQGSISMLHAPLMLEYNMGHMATREADFPVGFSVGGGMEYVGLRFDTDRFRQWAAIGSAAFHFRLSGRSYYLRASQSFWSSQRYPTTLFSLGNSF